MEPCQAENCSNNLHHLCQTQLEHSLGIECGLKKRCYACFIDENDKVPNATANIESEKSTNTTANSANVIPPGSELPPLFHPVTNPFPRPQPQPQQLEQQQKRTIFRTEETFHDESVASKTIAEKGGGSKLKQQTGFLNNSVVLCPQLFFHHHSKFSQMETMSIYKEGVGPYAYGKIVQVPNLKKKVTDYIVRYDESKDVLLPDGKRYNHSELCKSFPGVQDIKNLMKASVARANETNYRLNLKTNGKKTRPRKQQTTSSTNDNSGTESFFTPADHDGKESNCMSSSTLLSGILFEQTSITSNNMNSATMTNNGKDDNSDSDDGSNYDIEETAFFVEEDEDKDDDHNKSTPDGMDINYMSDDWKWNNWKDIDDDDSVKGPPEHDRYNGPHGIKDGFPNRFTTVLHCIFKSSAMSQDFFRRLAAQSNKYARKGMMERNSTLLLGHK